MSERELHVVTGAFGYTGRYIARQLLARGQRVRTLTGRPDRPSPFGDQVEVALLAFDRPDELAASLAGATTLYNTYWVRFPYCGRTFPRAVAHTRTLLRAAERAGVRRVVHVSIANPSADSPLGYFRGKALVERAIVQSALSYAILRPTVIFGREDILLNNIAWLLRRLPVFAVPGDGTYHLQPVYVEDFAALAVAAGEREDCFVQDAVGPEVYTFDALVRRIAAAIGSRARIVYVPPRLALVCARLLGQVLGDVLLTREEVAGLMADLLVSAGPPTAPTRFSAWLDAHAHELGRQYHSELQRHYR